MYPSFLISSRHAGNFFCSSLTDERSSAWNDLFKVLAGTNFFLGLGGCLPHTELRGPKVFGEIQAFTNASVRLLTDKCRLTKAVVVVSQRSLTSTRSLFCFKRACPLQPWTNRLYLLANPQGGKRIANLLKCAPLSRSFAATNRHAVVPLSRSDEPQSNPSSRQAKGAV